MVRSTTKDGEIKSKKKALDGGNNAEVNNSSNNINQVSNNNYNNLFLKEDGNEMIKMDENNIVNDKVDSRCCIM